MSQNGPFPGQPWPGRHTEEPYSEPSDPWGEHEPSQPWSPPPAPPIPQQQPYAPQWNQPQPQPKRGFAMGALVAVLSVLVGGGIATAAWFVVNRDDDKTPPVAAETTAPAGTGPRPQASEDARFATKGQCVRNDGTNLEPKLRVVACAANTYEVLKRVDGRTTGDKDAMGKCAKVDGYTKWYYYDTEYDDVDVVLCLREYGKV
ncbi:hypothetical protein FB565_004480 [Actinoplanes lutulentus]|uniref:Flagellar basal body-associated protein FliL n=1 Tax=Actinoplanes lutulentus TaxID=1287878 RepID=A0A327ZBM5_9ACTN|nr:hypothetical protein [Actinoplanes lutulentus]MBB2944747.1 hypothetical protein [Actinoplanes lutulentus]RAK35459.1 hypothetical protein B0I29_110215 [Actinoplanes lutulentus]